MTNITGISGAAVAAVVAGGVLAYSGLKNKSIGKTTAALITGNNPATAANNAGNALTADPTITSAAPSSGTGVTPAGSRGVVVSAAQSQLGKPYIWDTPLNFSDPNPSSFDCSGLTGWCYAKVGKTLAHFTGAQYLQLSHAPIGNAQPGDLIFYQSAGNIYHVAICIGGNSLIEAPTEGIPVRIRSYSPIDKDIMQTVGVLA